MATSRAALLQREKLFGTEGLVMDLAGGLDQVLEVCTGEEVSEIDEFAMILVFHIDDTPAVLTSANLLAADDDSLLAPDNSEGNDVLDLGVDGALFVVELVVIVWVHLQIVEGELLLYALLESTAFFECQGIRLGDDWNDVDNIGKLLQDDDVNWFQSMSRWLNEEETAVDSSILDVPLTLGRELFSQVS
jgi:hypothetical protein